MVIVGCAALPFFLAGAGRSTPQDHAVAAAAVLNGTGGHAGKTARLVAKSRRTPVRMARTPVLTSAIAASPAAADRKSVV